MLGISSFRKKEKIGVDSTGRVYVEKFKRLKCRRILILWPNFNFWLWFSTWQLVGSRRDLDQPQVHVLLPGDSLQVSVESSGRRRRLSHARKNGKQVGHRRAQRELQACHQDEVQEFRRGHSETFQAVEAQSHFISCCSTVVGVPSD